MNLVWLQLLVSRGGLGMLPAWDHLGSSLPSRGRLAVCQLLCKGSPRKGVVRQVSCGGKGSKVQQAYTTDIQCNQRQVVCNQQATVSSTTFQQLFFFHRHAWCVLPLLCTNRAQQPHRYNTQHHNAVVTAGYTARPPQLAAHA